MKRKIGLALAVILVGVFVVVYAQAKGEKVEPTSTPVSSSVAASSAPVATEEPAASTEPTAGDGVEDEPVKQVTEEGPTNEGATYEAEPSPSDYQETRFNELVNKYMTKWGCSQEEAEKMAKDIMNAGQQAAADEQKRLEETTAREKELLAQQAEEVKKESDAYYYERYGLSQEEVKGKSSEELCRLFMQKHGG